MTMEYHIADQFALYGLGEELMGPVAVVILCNKLVQQQETELESWLLTITANLKRDGARSYEFWLKAGIFPGKVSNCAFDLNLEDTFSECGEDQKSQIQQLLGYVPAGAIWVGARCNQIEDHHTLGHFMLHLARLFDGLIDMCGAISEPLRKFEPEERVCLEAWCRVCLEAWRNAVTEEEHAGPWPALPLDVRPPTAAERSASDVAALPGKIYEIYYVIDDGHFGATHIVDHEFLEAWMEHPSFHMVK
jgi:hypothetical protein